MGFAVARERRVCSGLQFCLERDVRSYAVDVGIGLFQFVDRARQRLLFDVAKHHLDAGLRQCGGNSQSDARGGSGDERGSSSQVFHAGISSFMRVFPPYVLLLAIAAELGCCSAIVHRESPLGNADAARSGAQGCSDGKISSPPPILPAMFRYNDAAASAARAKNCVLQRPSCPCFVCTPACSSFSDRKHGLAGCSPSPTCCSRSRNTPSRCCSAG